MSGLVTDGRMLLEEFTRLLPEVVVLDGAMPLLNGLDAGRQLKTRRPSVKLIYLTMNPNPDLAGEAFRFGASGYLLKSSAAQELKQAIQEALRGRSYITPLITRDGVGSLIRRARRVRSSRSATGGFLQLLAEGKSMKEVARSWSDGAHRCLPTYRMMEQLSLKTTAELVKFAVQQGVVELTMVEDGHDGPTARIGRR